MPHGMTIFNYLLGNLYTNAERTAAVLSWPVRDDGLSWYAHEPIGIQHVVGALFVFVVLCAMAFVAYGKVKDAASAIVPEDRLTVRTLVEVVVGGVYQMMADVMGPKEAKFFLPLIGTCAFFIFTSNALGLIPGFLPPTDKMNTTLACALVIFVSTHVFGVARNGLGYFKHFFGPILKWYALPLMLLMFVIEVISHLARPVSLAIRLMANMAADHMVLGIFLGMVPFIVPVPIMLLGTIVVIVQTVVFCLLSTVYIGLAVAHQEDHH
jgi:F-type H+-transporting ATPase subunit a